MIFRYFCLLFVVELLNLLANLIAIGLKRQKTLI